MCPCVAGGCGWGSWGGDQALLLGGRAPPPTPRSNTPPTLQNSHLPGSSPSSSFSSSGRSTGRTPSMTNYATFSVSSSSSGERPGSASGKPYIYIPPISDSTRLTMSFPKPQEFPHRSNPDWRRSVSPLAVSGPGLVRGEDTVDITADDTQGTQADLNNIVEAMNTLPARLAKIRAGNDFDDITSHITR